MSLDICAHITTIKVLQTYLESPKISLLILLCFCAVVRARKSESEKHEMYL